MGEFDTTLGPFLVGIFFNTFLYGLVCYQFAIYYRTKFNDMRAIKLMVLFLFILDTFHSASAIYMAWYYMVTNYANPQALAMAVWPYQFTPIGDALAALVTQLFLGFRIWRLTGNKILYGIVIVLAIPSFILATICSIEAWIIKYLADLPRITPIVIAWLTTQVVVDTFVTTTLIIVFHFSRTGFQRMDTALNRLIRGAIQTGLFADIFSIGILVCFVALPQMNFYGMFAIPIGRIYTNTLMDSLLARETIKQGIVGTFETSGATAPMSWAGSNGSSQGTTTFHSTNIQLDVKKTVDVHETMCTIDEETKAGSIAV